MIKRDARRVASLFNEAALLAKLHEAVKLIHEVTQEVASLELDVDIF